MKNVVKLTFLTVVALLATMAFAADAAAGNKISLHLTEPVSIAGTQLAPGDYKIFVTRDGDDAKVRVTDGPREVLNTTAKFRAMDKFVGDTALAKSTSHEVVELQSKKLKGALVFNSTAGASTAQGNSN
jgi:hypothetical protein